MGQTKRKYEEKHKPGTVFAVGLVTILILIGLVVGGVVLAMRAGAPDDMLLPDGIDGDGNDLPASLVPAVEELNPGDFIYDGLLSVVAKQNIPDFQNADDLSDEQLISFGIWAMLLDSSKQDSLTLREDGTMLIPAQAVAESVVAHFNLTRTVANQTTEAYSEFVYSEEDAAYIVPVYGSESSYLPRVRSAVIEEDGTATVELDYVSDAGLGEEGETPSQDTPAEKAVRVRLSGGGTDYKILSIETLALPQ